MDHVDHIYSDSQINEQIGELIIFTHVTSSPDEELSLARTPDNSVVFVKRLSIAYRFDKKRRQIFQQEAVFAQNLAHPGIAEFIGIEEIEGEVIQLFRWSDSMSLSQLLRLHREQGKRLPNEIGAYLICQIVRALEYLVSNAECKSREQPSLNVDLRPDSIFLTDSGQCQLVQFSLVTPLSISTSIIQLQDQSYLLYAAPEQCVSGIEPDARANLYTLGILIFEVLTSKPLFYYTGQLDKALIDRRKVRCLHPLMSDVDPDLAEFNDIANGLLQPLPQNRTHNLRQIIACLDQAFRNRGKTVSNMEIAAYMAAISNEATNVTHTVDGHEGSNRPDILSTIAEYNSS